MFHYVMKKFNYFHFDVDLFERYIRILKDKYIFIGIEEAKKIINLENSEKYMMLTFDDGTKDHYEYVYPILNKYNIKGVFFVGTNIFYNEILDIHLIHRLIAKVGIDRLYDKTKEIIDEKQISINEKEFINNIDMKKSKYPNKKVYVSYIKTKMNNYKDDEIKHFFEEYCDGVLIQEVRNQGGLISNIEKLKPNNHEKTYTLPCFYPFNTVIVTCEGYVTACCMDFQNYLVYGNLNEKKLQDIWNNDVIQELRKKHLNGKIEDTICKNCIDNKFEPCKPLMERYSCGVEFDKWRKE